MAAQDVTTSTNYSMTAGMMLICFIGCLALDSGVLRTTWVGFGLLAFMRIVTCWKCFTITASLGFWLIPLFCLGTFSCAGIVGGIEMRGSSSSSQSPACFWQR